MAKVGYLEVRETELSRGRGILLLNSSSPWASSADDLRALYASPYTSAVTTRTAVVDQKDIDSIQSITGQQDETLPFASSFEEDRRFHASSFLKDTLKTLEGGRFTIARGSLNSYGYSPHTLSSYLEWVSELFKNDPNERKKPVILSITGPASVIEATIIFLRRWIAAQTGAREAFSTILAVEINLSCPNIKGNDGPSGYDGSSIAEYVAAAHRGNLAEEGGPCRVSVGLKLPPYTYLAQFKALVRALSSAPTTAGSTDLHPIAFLTSTNTLGSSFWLNEGERGTLVKALPSVYGADDDSCDGTGGLAGESLHPISLGNVFRIANLLRASPDTRLHSIDIIGVGGVMSGLSAQRMKSAGSTAVALATALGREGIDVFERISREVLGDERVN